MYRYKILTKHRYSKRHVKTRAQLIKRNRISNSLDTQIRIIHMVKTKFSYYTPLQTFSGIDTTLQTLKYPSQTWWIVVIYKSFKHNNHDTIHKWWASICLHNNENVENVFNILLKRRTNYTLSHQLIKTLLIHSDIAVNILDILFTNIVGAVKVTDLTHNLK